LDHAAALLASISDEQAIVARGMKA